MNEILKTTASRVISAVLIILFLGACFIHFFGGDDSRTKEQLNNITDDNNQAGAEINRAITNIGESREAIVELETGLSRSREIIAEFKRDNDEAKRIIKRILDANQTGTT